MALDFPLCANSQPYAGEKCDGRLALRQEQDLSLCHPNKRMQKESEICDGTALGLPIFAIQKNSHC